MRVKLLSAVFLLYLLIIMFSFRLSPGWSKLEWGTTYLIITHADGSASWIIERRTLDVSYVQELSQNSTALEEYWQEFSKNVSALVKAGWVKTGRDGTAENLTLTTTIYHTTMGSYGTIKHQFDWVGFAETEGKRVVIGDVFVEGFFFLGDGSLVMEYPREYHTVQVSPTPDELNEDSQMITWHSVENFDFEQANIILEKETSSALSFLQEYALVFIGLIALVGIGSVSLWFITLRNRRKRAPSPLLSLGVEDEEEKVIALLKAANGPVYQSTITKQLGFSRSKTSKLLASMESKGIVARQKKGRDKVVILKK